MTSPSGSDYVVDDKAFLCIIRPSFEDTLPALFKVKNNYSRNAYFNSRRWGPAFGQSDLTIFGDVDDETNCNSCNHLRTYFQGDLCGNMLCGGRKCEARDKQYRFDIKEMNTFTVHIQDK